MDVTDELGDELAPHYLQLIGVCQWAIELGQIDIFHEVLCLSQYQASLHIRYLKALYHVFAYLKKHLDMGRIGYDPKTPVIDESVFQHNMDLYGGIVEELPARMPAPLGNPVTISAFVDANHAGNVVMWR